MPIQTTYTQARANLAKLFDEVTENREIVIVRRRRGEDIALVAADELDSLAETAHLFRSPKNTRRLTQEHRVVYLVGDDRIDFLQARYHY